MMLEIFSLAESLFLMTVRITSFFCTAPFFAVGGVPRSLKASLGFLIALLLLPSLPPGGIRFTTPLYLAVATLQEIFFGLALGFLASLIYSAVQYGGQILDIHMGLGMAHLLDPQNANPTSIMGQFFAILSLLIFLQVDGHHTLLLAMQESFRLIPLGGAGFDGHLIRECLKLFADMFSLAVRLVFPIIGILLMVDLVLSLLARTMPQLNIFILGFPLKAGLGMLLVSLFLPMVAQVASNLFSQMAADLALILRGWPH